MALYASAGVVGIVGLSYASVPLYQMFCQATGYGGTTQKATEEQFKNMKPVREGRREAVWSPSPPLVVCGRFTRLLR